MEDRPSFLSSAVFVIICSMIQMGTLGVWLSYSLTCMAVDMCKQHPWFISGWVMLPIYCLVYFLVTRKLRMQGLTELEMFGLSLLGLPVMLAVILSGNPLI